MSAWEQDFIDEEEEGNFEFDLKGSGQFRDERRLLRSLRAGQAACRQWRSPSAGTNSAYSGVVGRLARCAVGTAAVPSQDKETPLLGITWGMIQQVFADSTLVLEAHLPGTGKDGGPSCATVHPIQGWKRRSRSAEKPA